MPWLRNGDTSANHPVVLAVLTDERFDDRLLNECFGFVLRCALQSTAHLTDYIVGKGTAIQMAGPSRFQELISVALDAGYFTEVTDEDGRPAYKLIEDDTFIHMRTREEIEWERQRKNDNSNPGLIVPVRLRDGDACRYCGLVVNFHGDRRGQKAGTYDHLTRQVESPNDMVVACGKCNAALLDVSREAREAQMMPTPKRPYYKPKTLEWLRGHDYVIANEITLPASAEPHVRAGLVPPGREAGTEATRKTAQSTQHTSRSEGQSGSQPEDDPAGDVRSEGLPDAQSAQVPASAGHRSVGPSASLVGVDPAVSTAWSEGQVAGMADRDPAGGDSGPLGLPDVVSERAPAESRSRSQQIPAGREHPESRDAGSGRVGSVSGGVREGSGGAGSARSAPPAPDANHGSSRSRSKGRKRRR